MIQKLLDWIENKLNKGDTPEYLRGNPRLEELFKKERDKSMQDDKDEGMWNG
tara:strand:+ start:52 stop:207 length:156 start_codon:yes stop_codon:yes gene_type:complete